MFSTVRWPKLPGVPDAPTTAMLRGRSKRDNSLLRYSSRAGGGLAGDGLLMEFIVLASPRSVTLASLSCRMFELLCVLTRRIRAASDGTLQPPDQRINYDSTTSL